jgi:hypothetical protein
LHQISGFHSEDDARRWIAETRRLVEEEPTLRQAPGVPSR